VEIAQYFRLAVWWECGDIVEWLEFVERHDRIAYFDELNRCLARAQIKEPVQSCGCMKVALGYVKSLYKPILLK
jgi:hypothetical protein